MLVPGNKGPVGEWSFEGGVVHQLTLPVLEQSLASFALVASILEIHRLLDPKVVRLSQWMLAGEREVAQSVRVEKADLEVPLHSSKSFEDVFALCRSGIKSESVYPLTIEMSGSGIIITEQGDSVIDDLVWIRATTLDIFRISVGTQSDAWLPFSLAGDPQPEIYRLNAHRLTNALQEIEQQSGFNLEEGVESDYSVIKGFRLENIRYSDGSIVEVI
jgi:hypothetical protein